MARVRPAGSDWEHHHGSLQQANNEPLNPAPPPIATIDSVAARRGLPSDEEREVLAETRRRIEPAAAENPAEWFRAEGVEEGEPVEGGLEGDQSAEEKAGGIAGSATAQAVATAGTDAIAFYLPITFYGPRNYGIYVRQNRFFGFCAAVHKEASWVPWNDVTASVLQFLLHHEAYHAAVELSCLASDDFHERRVARTYRNYFTAVTGPWRYAYHSTASSYRCPEEQLAQHAGLSHMPRDASGEHIRSTLIRIFQKGPADYVYDPGAWPRSGAAKKPQAALERALHRVQSTGLARSQAPTSLNDIDTGIEPRAWFPPNDTTAVLKHTHGDVPVYIVDYAQAIATRFARACSVRNIAIRDFIRAVCRKCDVTHDKKGGKHPRLIVAKKHAVTYSRSAKLAPVYFIEQVADLLKMSKEDLITQCRL